MPMSTRQRHIDKKCPCQRKQQGVVMSSFAIGGRVAAIGASLLASTFPASQAFAQQGGTTPGVQKVARAGIETVTVTAERRETRLLDTPIAVSAIQGETIDKQHLNNLSDIAARVPSITFDQVNHSESFISLRGTW